MVIHWLQLQCPSLQVDEGCMLTGGRSAYRREPLGKVGLLIEQGEPIQELDAKLQSPWSGRPSYMTRYESCSTGQRVPSLHLHCQCSGTWDWMLVVQQQTQCRLREQWALCLSPSVRTGACGCQQSLSHTLAGRDRARASLSRSP